MKKTFFLLAFVFLAVSILNAQWTQGGGLFGGSVHTVENINGVIWAGTPSGITKSYDGGHSWGYTDILPSDSDVIGIDHEGDKIVLFFKHYMQYNKHILYSKDNGQSWTDYNLDSLSYVDGAFFAGGSLFLQGSLLYNLDEATSVWESKELPSLFNFVHDDKNFVISNQDVYLSKDFGESWNKIFSSEFPYPFGSHMIFVEDDLIILQMYDSVFVSHDSGESFKGNLFSTSNVSGFITRGKTGCLYMYTEYFLYESCDDGNTWNNLDISFLASDATLIDNAIIYGGAKGFSRLEGALLVDVNDGFIGQSTNGIWASPDGVVFIVTDNGVVYSNDHGLSWEDFTDSNGNIVSGYELNFMGDTIIVTTTNYKVFTMINGKRKNIYDANFAPKVSVSDSKIIIWENEDHVSISDNLGQTWDEINLPDDTRAFHVIGNDWVVFIGSSNITKVFVSHDSGNSWTETLSTNHMLGFRVVGDRLISHNWLISEDHGITWNQVTPKGLPNVNGQVINVTAMVEVGNTIYCAISNFGVFASSDGGKSWTSFNDGLIPHMGSSLATSGDKLFYTSINMGVWIFENADVAFKKGIVYYDENNNGVKDSSEKLVGDVVIKTNQIFTNSGKDGSFFFYTNTLTDSVSAISPSPFGTVSPVSYPITSALEGYDFGLYLEPEHSDLKVTLTNVNIFRPGFVTALNLKVENVGSVYQAPHVVLALENGLEFLSSIPAPTSIDSLNLIWDLDSLSYLESATIKIDVKPNAPLALGDTLHLLSTVFPIAEDEIPSNNSSILEEVLIGSYDPNDKSVNPNTNYSPNYLAEKRPLIYTIRFQNTGTYHADNVRITDTLSSNLDASTLKILSASHSMDWSIRGANAVEFLFKNIFLPDSTSNEVGSHGFVKYSILPKPELPLGTPIDNTAFIYFDFNEPIITNTTETKFDHLVALWSRSKNVNSIKIYPNPASDMIELHLKGATNGKGQMEIYDVLGKRIIYRDIEIIDGRTDLDLSLFVDGIYLTKIIIGADVFAGKFSVKKP